MSTNTIYGAKTQAKHLTCTGASATWTSNNPSYAITWSRTDFTKRPKPVYPDILFSPTSYSHSRGAKRDAFMWYWVKCSSGIFKGQMRPLPTTVNDYHGLAIPNVVLTPNTALLTNRLLAKIKDQRVNFAMSLAQARETASLFNDIAEKIRDALACKRRLLKGKKCRSGDYPPWLKDAAVNFLLRPMASCRLLTT